jgi:hypothetical protein
MMKKNCKIHGELEEKFIAKNTKGILLCKICRNEYADKWRNEHKEQTRLKSLELKKLAKENKISLACEKHGEVTGNDLYINIRCCKSCAICTRERLNKRHKEKKAKEPLTEYQILRIEKQKGHCKIHGENARTKTGQQACKYCRQESSERWRQKHPEKVAIINEKRRLIANGYRYKEHQRKTREFRKEKDPEAYNKMMADKARKYRETLPDAYIKQQIKNQRMFRQEGIKIPVESIPKELIDIKRLHIKLKKTLKERKNDN